MMNPEVELSFRLALFLLCSPVMEEASFSFPRSWRGKKLIGAENEFSVFFNHLISRVVDQRLSS